MINPGTLLDDIVTQLRLISELVTEFDGDASRIFPYYDNYPTSTSVTRAIQDMPAPGLLVMLEGGGQGGGQMQTWVHRFRLVLKLGEKVSASTGSDHYSALHLLVDGIPTGSALKLLAMQLNSGCDGMDVPRWERQSLIIDQAGNQMDFWDIRWAIPEKGDS